MASFQSPPGFAVTDHDETPSEIASAEALQPQDPTQENDLVDSAPVTGLEAAGETIPTKKKKKRSKKTTASRGPTALSKRCGTGFEEYFADPPMKPEEAMEEKLEIYHLSNTFEERMQACLTRFRSRRRLQGEATLFFNEYLSLGGIDTNPAPFSGYDARDLKAFTPAERRELTAVDCVMSPHSERFYNGNDTIWAVDFAGVVSGFLSISILPLTGLEPKAFGTAVGVVENFFRYILHHDVCPEYTEDVQEALAVCSKARVEWPQIRALSAALPGKFNLAAVKLFSQAKVGDWPSEFGPHLENFDASAAFYSSLVLTDIDPDALMQMTETPPKLVRLFDCTLEITKITRPTEEVIGKFRSLTLDDSHEDLEPLGKVTCKPAVIEDGWAHHQADPWPATVIVGGSNEQLLDLRVEDSILACMQPGMKMTVVLGELDNGSVFVQSLQQVVPTFYTFLSQELMRYYKAPRKDERPPPSIHDKKENEGGEGDEGVGE